MPGTTLYDRVAGRGLDRIAALSDGLFAFAMTVMVLDIHIPSPAGVHSEAQLWTALTALGPRIITYLMSFLTLGIFWLAQQTQLHHMETADRDFSWLHMTYLAFVAVLPFSTSLLAEYISYRTALVIYWANILALGALLYLGWIMAERHGLVKDDVPDGLSRAVRRRILTAQACYAVGALLCIISTYVSIAFIVLVQLYFATIPARLFNRRPAASE